MTDDLRVPDPEVLTFIADRVTSNIRELEGALTRVIAYASLTGRPISVDVAREVLKDVFPGGERRSITIEQIQQAVCDAYGVSLVDLRGDKRPQVIVLPRHIAMYLCRELTDQSLPKIGAKFGGRDHATVMYGVNRVARPHPRGPRGLQRRPGPDGPHQAGPVSVLQPACGEPVRNPPVLRTARGTCIAGVKHVEIPVRSSLRLLHAARPLPDRSVRGSPHDSQPLLL